jgi:hypothetical protein
MRRLRPLLAGPLLVAALSPAKPVTPAHPTNVAVALNAATVTVPAPDTADEPAATPLFDTTPSPLPPNLTSVAFEATGTSEFGDLVRLDGQSHLVGSFTIVVTSSAVRTDFAGSQPLGFTQPITLTLYDVDRSGPAPKPGPVIVRTTEAFLIPWLPEADASAGGSRTWKASDGVTYNGQAVPLTFDLAPFGLSLPHEVIYGISFNTEHYGPDPSGRPGPANFLGVAVNNRPAVFGTDVEPDAVFWRTTLAMGYADAGSSGVNIFRHDTGWALFQPAVRFGNSTYGALAALAARLAAAERDPGSTLASVESLVTLSLDRSLWDGNSRPTTLFGRYLFEFLAEAADELAQIADLDAARRVEARHALDVVMRTTGSLAQAALGDALIFGGDARRVVQSQDALDNADDEQARGLYGDAVTNFGHAWQEAELAFE